MKDTMIKVVAKKHNTNIRQLEEALFEINEINKVIGVPLIEIEEELGVLADNGIKGAEAGIALKNIIISLVCPTNEATKKLNKMKINIFDSEEKFRNVIEILKDIDKYLKINTSENKEQVLSKIFNKVDLKSINALLDVFNEI